VTYLPTTAKPPVGPAIIVIDDLDQLFGGILDLLFEYLPGSKAPHGWTPQASHAPNSGAGFDFFTFDGLSKSDSNGEVKIRSLGRDLLQDAARPRDAHGTKGRAVRCTVR
jgi:hypothetical protein